MASARHQAADEIVEFSTRFNKEFDQAVGKRMKDLGIPEESIGIRNYPGVDEGAFTRFPDTQIGGNVNPNVIANKPRGIALDHGIMDTAHPTMSNVPTWAKSKLSDRVDAAIVHEYIESTLKPPQGLTGPQAIKWLHKEAIRRSSNTTLPISDTARKILKEYRSDMGLN